MSYMLSSILSSRQGAWFLYKATECCLLPQSFQFFVCVELCVYVCVRVEASVLFSPLYLIR